MTVQDEFSAAFSTAFDPTPTDVEDEVTRQQAEAAVRAWCGWHVAPSLREVLVLDGPGGPVLLLPSLHVTDIGSITEDGLALDPAYYSWSASGMVRRLPGDAYYYRTPAWWTARYRALEVDLTHGYDTWPADVQAVIDRLMSRADNTTGNVTQVGAVQYATGADGMPVGNALTASDQAALAPYKLPPRP